MSDRTSLWNLLGIQPTSDVRVIDSAYKKIQSKKKNDLEMQNIQFAWKLLRDPFLRDAYAHYKSTRVMKNAGFFNDGAQPGSESTLKYNSNWLVTPVHKLKRHPDSGAGVVLLSTGGFNPIHNGHIEMMEIAKKAIEKTGKKVLGGYFSPSHDDYVQNKYGKEFFLDSSHRIYLAQKAVLSHSWIHVDPWEARYNKIPLTYTDVILRLERYLIKHLHVPIEVMYVFGSDNAEFARTFISKGACVCVKRANYEKLHDQIRQETEIKRNKNILFSDGISSTYEISSRAIRLKKQDDIPEVIKEDYLAWTSARQVHADTEEKVYIIRDDFTWAESSYKKHIDSDLMHHAKNNALIQLKNIIRQSVTFPSFPDKPTTIRLQVITLETQIDVLRSILTLPNVINNDVCTRSKYKINASRLFGLSDDQQKKIKIVPRPGYSPLDVQFSSIPPGKYFLLDDDSATGISIETLSIELLKKGIETKRKNLLKEFLHVSGQSSKNIFDVVDLRDFIFGSRDGGLVVELPNGEICRAPYVLPYVSLASRAKIPVSRELSASLKIWKLNKQYYIEIGDTIFLKDVDIFFQQLMKYIGFSDHDKMSTICNWHIRALRSTATFHTQ